MLLYLAKGQRYKDNHCIITTKKYKNDDITWSGYNTSKQSKPTTKSLHSVRLLSSLSILSESNHFTNNKRVEKNNQAIDQVFIKVF